LSQSAFIVRVAEAEPLVSDLRLRFDASSARGVPAHVTVLYPFMALDQISDTVIAIVDKTLSRFSTFRFSLTHLCRWPEVTYLAPSPAEPFVAMTRAIANQFAAFPPYSGQYQDIIPHLTVASGDAASATVAENELAFPFKQAGPVQSTCRAVEWIENSSGMWKVFRVINLQNSDA